MIQDDMLFSPYPYGGYQCKINTSKGTIYVRTGAVGLFITQKEPYEVRYPNGEIRGRQTADDIFNYIKALNRPKGPDVVTIEPPY